MSSSTVLGPARMSTTGICIAGRYTTAATQTGQTTGRARTVASTATASRPPATQIAQSGATAQGADGIQRSQPQGPPSRAVTAPVQAARGSIWAISADPASPAGNPATAK